MARCVRSLHGGMRGGNNIEWHKTGGCVVYNFNLAFACALQPGDDLNVWIWIAYAFAVGAFGGGKNRYSCAFAQGRHSDVVFALVEIRRQSAAVVIHKRIGSGDCNRRR